MMRIHPAAACAAILSLSVSVAACKNNQSSTESAVSTNADSSKVTAVADLHPTTGNVARGTVTLTQESDGVHIVANLEGLEPGDHALTILETTACNPGDSTTSMQTFNPSGTAQSSDGRQGTGDLGTLTADASGNARIDKVDPNLKLNGPDAVVGHALVVHARGDRSDNTSSGQPNGQMNRQGQTSGRAIAGPGVACAVITVLQPGGGGR